MKSVASLAARRGALGRPAVVVDDELLAEVATALDLRYPNESAVATIVHRLASYDRGGLAEPFEAVVDAATGVGKTFIVAAAMDYLAASAGCRNFVVIAPGRTILNKTVGNFTPGGRKSLTDAMAAKPVVITSENFATPSIRAAMDDDQAVKLFVFTVQALTEPTSKASRRTRKFQEGLGKAFYDHLVSLTDLVVFADEHHVYYGKKFSKAVRGLDPFALIGLTATPHPDTPPDRIIFRYPLANAIADRLVKTPVLVGRTDDLTDVETKLRDGLTLLEAKDESVKRYCEATGSMPINPIMLVVCESIDQAKEVEATLRSRSFFDARYADSVLRIDSDVPDASLAALAEVEEPESPVRVIVSVGMLKEGWDVANVYVIASLRPSISEILTEQTLGRGLRLPWGSYTDVELLDTLEVLAHERYEDLLARAKALKAELIDWRTSGSSSLPSDPGTGRQLPLVAALSGSAAADSAAEGAADLDVADSEFGGARPGGLTLVSAPSRLTHAREAASEVARLAPRQSCGVVSIPVLEVEVRGSSFSLADVTDLRPFRELGRQLRLDPDDVLRRTLLSARPVVGRDGITRIELDTRPGTEEIHSQGTLLSAADAKPELIRRLVLAPHVPTRGSEMRAAEPLVDAFLEGLGDAASSLGAYIDRAAAGLIDLVAKAATRKATRPDYREVVRLEQFAPVRTPRHERSSDRFGEFRARIGYTGWKRSMHEENWFDSKPERSLANALDASPLVRCWARLLRGDLPILWSDMARYYHPDFLVVERATNDGGSGIHWIIEVKSERDLATFDVQEKREAAERWAARVTADPLVTTPWRYVLLGETDLAKSRGSWKALRSLYAGR